MGQDKETKLRLLISAKAEFSEKGYMKASLRNICKNAGVTTGALYFFFTDKSDLFAALVQKPLDALFQVMYEHYEEEVVQAKANLMSAEDISGDLYAAKQIIHYLYQYREEFLLILTKSQGSSFDGVLDQFVEITEKHYRLLADTMAAMKQSENVDDYLIHWMAHMTIDIFVHMLTHEDSEEESIKHIEFIMKYLISGWYGLF